MLQFRRGDQLNEDVQDVQYVTVGHPYHTNHDG